MKFLKPLKSKSTKSKPTSFAEKRSLLRDSSIAKAQAERKKLIHQEYSSLDPLRKAYQQKGSRLDARIRNLKDNS